MKPSERQEYMEKADTLTELLSYTCDVPKDEARELEARIDKLESFFENQGFSRSKPWKMAVLYVMMRHGHTCRTVEQWWGKTESSYNSISKSTAQEYLEDIKQLINEEVEYEENTNWTPGDAVYEPRKDPLDEHFDMDESGGANMDITSFG